MSDYIIRGMAADKQVRFFAANTKELVEKARQIHNTSPIATAALGRLMTGTAMMGSMCKNDSDIVTVQIKGDGPMGGLVVTSDAKARVMVCYRIPGSLLILFLLKLRLHPGSILSLSQKKVHLVYLLYPMLPAFPLLVCEELLPLSSMLAV